MKFYEYFNEMETDLQGYPQETLSDLQKKRLKRRIKSEIGGFTSRNRALKIACILLCFVVPCAAVFKNEVAAAFSSVSDTFVFWFLGGDKDADPSPYMTVINTPIENKGMEVTLESVIVDEKEIFFSTLQQFPADLDLITATTFWGFGDFDSFKSLRDGVPDTEKERWDGSPLLATEIYVNDKKLKGELTMIRSFEDKNNHNNKTRVLYTFEKAGEKLDTSRPLTMKLDFGDALGINNGNWTFSFKADGSELAAVSTVIPLHKEIALPDGNTITLTEYKRNAMGASLYYTGEVSTEYNLKLRGKNDQGETVWFDQHFGKDGGRFLIDSRNIMRTVDTQSYTLTLYTLKTSDYPDRTWKPSDYTAYGDAFTLELN